MFLGVEESTTKTAKSSCSFPFKYNGHTYNTCTTAGDSQGRYWCAINIKDKDKHKDMKGSGKWVWCDSRTSTTGTRKCKMPFKYKDLIYNTCTTTDHHSEWCYFEEKAGSWGLCSGITAETSCVFPFKYNGHTYNTCTTAGDSQGRLWCAININDKDKDKDMKGTGKWVWCDSRTSTKGTRKCKIPFKYNDVSYNGCTTADHHSEWCYFEEKAGSWGLC